MRWSTLFIPTLREEPAEAEAPSHRLLLRAGFIRQLMSGHYALLPLAVRVADKVKTVIRDEMTAIGGQEFTLPTMHPAEIWQRSGRWETMGDEMFRLTDRRGSDLALGMTHEEIFTWVAAELASYRDLPQIWYQLQLKFRDEPRPKSGLLRVREFIMKDSYSFDLDEEGLDAAFDLHHGAYERIFARLGIEAVPVQASSGSMGGNASIEFVSPSPTGEDDIVRCPTGDYAANIERASAPVGAIDDGVDADAAPEQFPTPGIKTIAALAKMDGGAPADRQIKTLVFVLDGTVTLALVRGDHDLVEQKLIDATGAIEMRPADADEIKAALGAYPGSLGGVGVVDRPIYVDEALVGRYNMTTGANIDKFHLRGVSVARHIQAAAGENATVVDLRAVSADEPCPKCGAPLRVDKGIEVGHIFKLGRGYAEALGVTVLDENGVEKTPIMGSYGIGVERAVAAIIEAHHDEKGIVWPVDVAPFEIVVTPLSVDDEMTVTTSESIYEELRTAGLDVIIDDRDQRPGVKFKDAELVGIPYRVTVGHRGLARGIVEFTTRATGVTEEISPDLAAAHAMAAVAAARSR